MIIGENGDYRFNPAGVRITIENNVERTPTRWSEEATAAIMRRLVEVAPTARPEFRGQFEALRGEIAAMIFEELTPRFRQAMNRVRERTVAGKDY